MGQSVLADNWSLQDIAQLLDNGIPDGTSSYLRAPNDAPHHELPVASGIVALEALFDLLTDIVLRDQIIIDQAFAYVWNGSQVFSQLEQRHVLKQHPFLPKEEQIAGPRTEILKRLLVSESLKQAHLENEQSFARSGSSVHGYLGSVVWGGAGMLARATVFEVPYSPHPIRRDFMRNSGIGLPSDSAVANITAVVREERAVVRRATRGGDALHNLQLEIDPIPVMVISEAGSASELISVAFQLRDEFRGLRDWLGEYQNALLSDSFASVKAQHDLLRSVQQHVRARTSGSWLDRASLTTGITSVSLAVESRPINWVLNRFGVRSVLNDLIFRPGGRPQLAKLLGFFSHSDSALGAEIVRHFTAASP